MPVSQLESLPDSRTLASTPPLTVLSPEDVPLSQPATPRAPALRWPLLVLGLGVLLFHLLAGLLDARGLRVTGYLLVHAFGAGLTADLMKLVFTRVRPYQVGNLWDNFASHLPMLADPLASGLTPEVRSFPSGHAATAAGLAIALSRLYPKGIPLFALFAGLAAVQRVVSTAHFARDCAVSVAIAFAVAYAFYQSPLRLHERWLSGSVELSGA